MAKFCTSCGTKLEEGQICACQAAPVNNTQPTPQPTQNQDTTTQQQYVAPTLNTEVAAQHSKNIMEYLKQLLAILISILRNPVTEGRTFTSSSTRNYALGFIGFQALASSLFALVICSKINSALDNAIGFAEGFLGSFSGVVDGLGFSIEISLFKVFLSTFVISVILSIVLAILFFVFSKLFKNSITIGSALSIASIRSAVLIVFSLLAIIVGFLNPTWGIFVFFTGNLLAVCLMVAAFPTNTVEKNNTIPYIVFLTVFVFMIISILVMFKNVGFYMPDEFGEIMEFIENPSSIMDSFLDQW